MLKTGLDHLADDVHQCTRGRSAIDPRRIVPCVISLDRDDISDKRIDGGEMSHDFATLHHGRRRKRHKTHRRPHHLAPCWVFGSLLCGKTKYCEAHLLKPIRAILVLTFSYKPKTLKPLEQQKDSDIERNHYILTQECSFLSFSDLTLLHISGDRTVVGTPFRLKFCGQVADILFFILNGGDQF